jgi:hypothetical protein
VRSHDTLRKKDNNLSPAAAAAATTARAAATLSEETAKCTTTADTMLCRFKFLFWADFMHGCVVCSANFDVEQKSTSERSF